MRGNRTAQTAYCILLICAAFVLGYLIGRGGDKTELQVNVAPAQSVQETVHGQAFPEELNRESDGPVDLNTASKEELEQLPGIGPALADRIITYRQQNGAFTSKEQIMEVSGIGEKRYEDLKDLITIGGTK